jgi:hypothetical protein
MVIVEIRFIFEKMKKKKRELKGERTTPGLLRPGAAVALNEQRGITSILGHVLSDLPLDVWVRSHVKVQVILVDVDNLDPLLFRVAGERVIALDCFGVINHAFPVAMVQLCRPDEWEEPRRIDLVYNPVLDEHDVLAELLIDIGNAAGYTRHGPEDFQIAWRIFANGRRIAIANWRHNGCPPIVLVIILLLHPLGDPRLDGNWRTPPQGERVAAN